MIRSGKDTQIKVLLAYRGKLFDPGTEQAPLEVPDGPGDLEVGEPRVRPFMDTASNTADVHPDHMKGHWKVDGSQFLYQYKFPYPPLEVVRLLLVLSFQDESANLQTITDHHNSGWYVYV